ncbi:hypothetical protein [Legionella maioricensis]|uniref:Uncharacterized protein n=1 Tax=Legionella maioricensis TaxID=2896528 RepID=A0A9X2IBT7_9GAMM|nr:hypothetical protein [Legionella maioricensis]MCL9683722.1 hypothetical protein [Legionella maioricensis]MCL9687496.1 hypothetical protein [Legionella maioricensis]
MENFAPLKNTITSDMMHNRNCHAYLLQLKPFIHQEILNLEPTLTPLATLSEKYNELFPYGNLYSQVIETLENQIDSLYLNLNAEQINILDDLVFAVYHNDNLILEHTHWINDIGVQTRPMQTDTSRRIQRKLEDNNSRINRRSPNQAGNILNLIGAFFSLNYKPQLDTNLPSLKNYSYRKNTEPTEYRFSTQAQRHNGTVRISPLFKRWLTIKAQKSPPEQSICHIYFNNLGLDRSDFDFAGSKERNFSLALHELEDDPSLKIAVITFPASKSLMDDELYKKTTDQLAYASVFKELIEIAKGNEHQSGVSDFHISSKIRNQLFGTKENQLKILKKLLARSFKAQGINPSDTLSTAQKQAVWVHFTKFELTNYIINTLKPQSYNFSCKDAIDRGAVSSIYYNLFKSFQSENPIQKEEFERAIDAAAANVKGRGMNFHRKIIWSALDNYVDAHYDDLVKDSQRAWLIFWRDMNCPHSRVQQLLNTKIIQCQKQLDSLPSEYDTLKKTGNRLISAIQKQYLAQIKGQRLLLELVSRTSELLTTNSTSLQSIQSYRNLTKELKINQPALYVIGGLAEIFLGILLYIPSFGYSKSLITHGFSTYDTGFFASSRILMNQDIIDFSETYISAAIV